MIDKSKIAELNQAIREINIELKKDNKVKKLSESGIF